MYVRIEYILLIDALPLNDEFLNIQTKILKI